MTNDLLHAALSYAADGLSVIPVRPSDKKPLISWSEFTKRIASEAEIRSWWRDWPDANIGVVTGAVSGVIVLDLDVSRGITQEQAAAVYARAPTGRIAVTGSGGYHLWYRYPAGVSNVPNRVNVVNGIDVRGDGGYVVVPPSLHGSGRRYTWMLDGYPGELPADVLETVLGKHPVQQDQNPKWVTDLLAGVTRGGRNDACARLAGYFASKGMPKDVTMALLVEWNRKNRPPLPGHEIQTTVDSVYRTAKRREDHQQAANTQGQLVEPKPFTVVPISQYMAQYGDAQVQWIVEEWLPKDTIAFAVSPPGSYKTWSTIDLIVSVATGTPFLGKYRVNDPGPVIYIQQEDPHYLLAERMALIAMSRYHPEPDSTDPEEFVFRMPPDMPVYIHPDRSLRFDDPATMAGLEQMIAAIRPRLVVLDPLYSATSTDDYMAKSATQMLQLKTFRDKYGCSFMIAHHTKKRSEGPNREDLWGSQFLNALLETGWQIRKTDADNVVYIRRHFKVSPAVPGLRIEFDISTKPPYHYSVKITEEDQDSSGSGKPTESVQIVDLLQQRGPMTVTEVANALNISKSTASRKLAALAKDRMVVKDQSGKYRTAGDLPSF